jgi:2-methylisocitrate lyase-like PEP mutase family enzyme
MNVARPATFRQRLSQGGCVAAPGVYDAFSARIVERLGFEAVYLGGNALGLHFGVGQPFVTLTETTAAVQQIRRVTHVPVIVDAGAGFGDAAHAALGMRALVNAGAAAVHIDDQVYPKRAHYHRGRGHLAESAVVCGKLRAMAAARDGQDTLLIARTDALRVTGSVDATIARCGDYLAAGADALMVLDLGPDRIASFRQAFPDTPFFWIVGLAETVPTQQELGAAGFAVAVYPFNSIGAVHEAILAAWRGYAESGRPGQFNRPAPAIAAEALAAIGLEASLEIERETTEAAERK